MSHLRIVGEYERPSDGNSLKFHLRQHAERMRQNMIAAQTASNRNEPISFTVERRIRKPTGKRFVGYDIPWQPGIDPYESPDPKIAK